MYLAAHFVGKNNTAVNDADAKPMTSVNASTWRIGNAALLLLLLYQPPALSSRRRSIIANNSLLRATSHYVAVISLITCA